MSEPGIQHHPVLGAIAFNPAMFWWQTRSTVPLGDTDQVMLTLTVGGDPDIP